MEKPETPVKCRYVSWDEAYRLGKKLALKIKASGFRPDIIIGVSRGGLVPARIVCDILHQKDLAAIKVEHWGIASTLGTALIKYPLPDEAGISGKNVLVVDDVADTGDTYNVILEHLKEKSPLEIRTAVLQYKTSSSFVPDYWGEKHEVWKWIIYPWAVYEDMTGFIKRVLLSPMTAERIRKSLKSEFDVKISRNELREIMTDMVREGMISRVKKGSRIYWEKAVIAGERGAK